MSVARITSGLVYVQFGSCADIPGPYGDGLSAVMRISQHPPPAAAPEATAPPIDFSRACARPARAFSPSSHVLTSFPDRFSTLYQGPLILTREALPESPVHESLRSTFNSWSIGWLRYRLPGSTCRPANCVRQRRCQKMPG